MQGAKRVDGGERVHETPTTAMRRARPRRASAKATIAALHARDGRDVPAFARPQRIGSVALVGAGPGDPELLTLKAVRLLRCAEAVVYDRLVTASVLALAPRRSMRIFVGKARDLHAMSQSEINALLVRLARQGLRVVRLKGGDPFVFGRGGEEIEALAAHGVPFDVVPGISAANGVAASARIPLTHREHAQACLFVTGHLKDGTLDLDWSALARPRQTLVVYMGLTALPALCRELVQHGLPAATPAAAIANGTLPQERVVTATVATLGGAVAEAGLASPALVIVGDVVDVRSAVVDQLVAASSAGDGFSSRRSLISAPPSDGVALNP